MAIPGLGLGRVVIFIDGDGTEYAAIISGVVDRVSGVVNLHVFVDDSLKPVLFFQDVSMNEVTEKPAPHSWHWPPRV